MRKLPFKEIDAQNWLEPDPIVLHFTGMEHVHDYVETVLAPKLSENVPHEVMELFEVARGAMLYGYVFYPLYALGAEQLFRVGETALRSKCEQLGMPTERRRFVDLINWLVERRMISDVDAERWNSLRERIKGVRYIFRGFRSWGLFSLRS